MKLRETFLPHGSSAAAFLQLLELKLVNPCTSREHLPLVQRQQRSLVREKTVPAETLFGTELCLEESPCFVHEEEKAPPGKASEVESRTKKLWWSMTPGAKAREEMRRAVQAAEKAKYTELKIKK